VNELSRKGFDSDQIAEVVRITADTATRQLAATWQERWRTNSLRK
jgi:SOS response regulatory protein OraA/RecX